MNSAQRVLVIEDNEDDVFFMRRVLRGVAPHVTAQYIADGQSALEFLRGAGQYADRDAHPLPDLIFLDLKLPFVNGLDVLAVIRGDSSLKPLRVVILTSSSEERDQQQAWALGIEAYLVKPPTREMLQPFFAKESTTTPAA